MPPPEDHLGRHVPPAWYAPYGGPDHDAETAWCVSVLHSVTACSFRAGLALEHVRANARLRAAGVDRAPGLLDGIAGETRRFAFQLHISDTRIWRTGSAGDGESGTG